MNILVFRWPSFQVPYSLHIGMCRSTFIRGMDDGKVVSLDGHYEFYSADSDGVETAYIWFSQSLRPTEKSSTYIIHRCLSKAKRRILDYAKGSNPILLTQAFVPDAFLMNDCLVHINDVLSPWRNLLLKIEQAEEPNCQRSGSYPPLRCPCA